MGTFYKIARHKSPGYFWLYFANPFFPIQLRSGISSVWTYVTLSHKKYFKKSLLKLIKNDSE